MNALRGKVVCPDRNSETFVSVVGSLDTRVELDSHLKHGDAEYNAHLSMMAAKLSYENKRFVETTVEGRWKMEHLLCEDFQNAASDPPTCHNQKQPSTRATKSQSKEKPLTRAIMFKDQELIVVAFRGTRPFDADAWCTDIDISWYEISIEGKEEPVRIHGGFMKALGLQVDKGWLYKESDEIAEDKSYAYYEIKKKLRKLLSDERKRFIVTGHSLGGALAILFVGALCIEKEDAILKKLEGVYTFGQPRVGDARFGRYMKRMIQCEDHLRYYRYVYSSDVVPRLPFDGKVFGFKHFGSCCYINCLYKGKLLKEAPDKNCTSLIWFIPKILIAIWELIRAFIMPCVYGSAYRESWFLLLLRMVGIIFPGVPAHMPQDYDNLTRLAPRPPTKKTNLQSFRTVA